MILLREQLKQRNFNDNYKKLQNVRGISGKRMILGIDASNIRGSGGGVTHLSNLLNTSEPSDYEFEKVFVWGEEEILNRLNERSWLIKKQVKPGLDRIFWQLFRRSKEFAECSCDVVFFPGGSYLGKYRSFVVMSQNMLPFEINEAKRFGCSFTFFRYILLRWFQMISFRRSAGVIFLTEYARTEILKKTKIDHQKTVVIPHGIDESMINIKRNFDCSVKILYVSTINYYKHQDNVALAISQLRKEGIPVELILIGPFNKNALSCFNKKLASLGSSSEYISYLGPMSRLELFDFYKSADIFVFASSCENMPIILLEAMSAALPIACSNRGPMKEVLADAGVYFNPESVNEIYIALKKLISSKDLRATLGEKAQKSSAKYTWNYASGATFSYLRDIAKKYNAPRR